MRLRAEIMIGYILIVESPRSKSMEYRPQTTVADTKLREQVAAAGVRALMRATGLSQHTIEAIRAGRRVRNATIQRLIAVLR